MLPILHDHDLSEQVKDEQIVLSLIPGFSSAKRLILYAHTAASSLYIDF